MRVLKNRLQSFEIEHLIGKEQDFLQRIRTIRLFGLDLADSMSLDQSTAESYAGKLVGIYTENNSNADSVLDQVLCDLHDIGIAEHRSYLEQKLAAASEAALKGKSNP
jgi:hypothetical protein